eukprot:361102-Chlamydomonas_euryale.AAC.2
MRFAAALCTGAHVLAHTRLRSLIEQADYAAAKELFGGGSGINLHTFLPKSVKDFEDFASEIVQQ